jgi:hypothetical protein
MVMNCLAYERPSFSQTLLFATGDAVSWEQHLSLDREERRRGEKKAKPREKVTSVREMLEIMNTL